MLWQFATALANQPCTMNTKAKWLAYTVLVGLIPLFARLAIWITAKSVEVHPIAPSDIIVFGLVLHITNINEMEHVDPKDETWRTIQNAISVVFIAIYCVLYAMTVLGESRKDFLDLKSMLYCLAGLAVASLILSFSVLHRISIAPKVEST